MEVEHERDAGEPQRQAGEHQEVRQRVHLDERVAPPGVGEGRRDRGRGQNATYSARYVAIPAPWWRLDVEAVEADAVDHVTRRFAGTAQREDVHRAAGGHEGLGLAADARVLLVVGVDDHADGSGHARAALQERHADMLSAPQPGRGTRPVVVGQAGAGSRRGDGGGARDPRPPVAVDSGVLPPAVVGGVLAPRPPRPVFATLRRAG